MLVLCSLLSLFLLLIVLCCCCCCCSCCVNFPLVAFYFVIFYFVAAFLAALQTATAPDFVEFRARLNACLPAWLPGWLPCNYLLMLCLCPPLFALLLSQSELSSLLCGILPVWLVLWPYKVVAAKLLRHRSNLGKRKLHRSGSN